MKQALSFEQIKELVFHEIQKIDDVKLYFTCKELHLRLTRHPATRQYIKICVALANLGLPITPTFLNALLGKTTSTIYIMLHSLGDKHILTLKRRDSDYNYEYVVSPWFLEKVL